MVLFFFAVLFANGNEILPELEGGMKSTCAYLLSRTYSRVLTLAYLLSRTSLFVVLIPPRENA